MGRTKRFSVKKSNAAADDGAAAATAAADDGAAAATAAAADGAAGGGGSGTGGAAATVNFTDLVSVVAEKDAGSVLVTAGASHKFEVGSVWGRG